MKTRQSLFPLIVLLGLALAGCGKPAAPTPSTSGDSPAGTAPDSSAATAAAVTAIRNPTAPADLRLRWTPGQRQHQRLAMTMNSESSGGPIPNPIKQDVTMNMESSLSVVGPREGGGQELELVMGDMDMSVMMGEREVMSFDSRGESLGADNQATGMFRAMVGSKLKYLMNSSNRVEKVEGWQEVIQKVSAEAPAAGRGMMAGLLTEDYFKQMADFGYGLPNRTVSPGESWPVQQEVAMGPLGRIILDLNYTFKGWEIHERQQCAAVTFTGTVSTKPSDTPSQFGKMEMQGGKAVGTYWFNPDTGRLVESTLQQELTMIMDIGGAGQPAPAGGAPAAGGKITTRMNQKIQLKFSPEAAK